MNELRNMSQMKKQDKIYETEISNLVDKQFNNGHKKCA